MRILSLIFGLFWCVFGLNGLFHFFPTPAPAEQSAYFMQAMERSSYALPLIYGSELVGGFMLVLGCLAPLGLLLLAPITANIVLYDLFLNRTGLAIGIVIAALHAFLLWRNRSAYTPLLTCNA